MDYNGNNNYGNYNGDGYNGYNNGYNNGGYNGYNNYNYNNYQTGGYYPNGYNNQNNLERMAKEERKKIRSLGNVVGLTMCLYLVFQLIVSFGLVMNSTLYSLYLSSSTFYYSFSMIAVSLFCVAVPFAIMAYANRQKYISPLIPSKKVNPKDVILWVGFGMFCCVVADYLVSIITYWFSTAGVDISTSEDISIDSPFGAVLCLIGLAVMPALCEEFAMRCCSVGLLKKYGKAFAVVSVSIMFGILHLNVTQFIFATLIGLILGYVTIKTDSIWPAIIIHFCNNAMSAFSDIFQYMFKNSTGALSTLAENSVTIFFIFWLIVGLVALIVLAVRGDFKKKIDDKETVKLNSTGRKVWTFFCCPGMIIPFIFFIYYCISSIS